MLKGHKVVDPLCLTPVPCSSPLPDRPLGPPNYWRGAGRRAQNGWPARAIGREGAECQSIHMLFFSFISSTLSSINQSLCAMTRTWLLRSSSPNHPKVKLLAADGQEPGDDMRQGPAIIKLPTRTDSRSLGMLGTPSEMLDSENVSYEGTSLG